MGDFFGSLLCSEEGDKMAPVRARPWTNKGNRVTPTTKKRSISQAALLKEHLKCRLSLVLAIKGFFESSAKIYGNNCIDFFRHAENVCIRKDLITKVGTFSTPWGKSSAQKLAKKIVCRRGKSPVSSFLFRHESEE